LLNFNENIYENFSDLLPLDLQGWGGGRKIFRTLIDEINPILIIEVGTWKGQSAINMASYLKEKKLEAKIICVDTWLGGMEFMNSEDPRKNLIPKNGYPQIYYQFLSNVIHKGLQNYIIPFPNTSLIAARYLKNNNITSKFIYIDGSHNEQDVLMDLNNYWKLLESGGIIFGDDYKWGSVKRAVDTFVTNNMLKITIVDDVIWIIRKS